MKRAFWIILIIALVLMLTAPLAFPNGVASTLNLVSIFTVS